MLVHKLGPTMRFFGPRSPGSTVQRFHGPGSTVAEAVAGAVAAVDA